MQHRVIVNNLGYARDIDGALISHFSSIHRHLCTSHEIQKRSLNAYKNIMKTYDPHLCCILEIDTGSFTSGDLNQFEYITDPAYPYHDVCSKYAVGAKRAEALFTKGKSNGFMAKLPYAYERVYFSLGSKRLVYRIVLEKDLILYFTHLSLKFKVRQQQMRELKALIDKESGDVILAGDFNILAGLDELDIFLGDGKYILMNKSDQGTFTLFGRHYLLDICIASKSLAPDIFLEIIDQPFSDHDALFFTIERN